MQPYNSMDAFFCLKSEYYYQVKKKRRGALDTLFLLSFCFCLHFIGDRSYNNNKYGLALDGALSSIMTIKMVHSEPPPPII